MATEGEALVPRIPAGRFPAGPTIRRSSAAACSDAGAHINGGQFLRRWRPGHRVTRSRALSSCWAPARRPFRRCSCGRPTGGLRAAAEEHIAAGWTDDGGAGVLGDGQAAIGFRCPVFFATGRVVSIQIGVP